MNIGDIKILFGCEESDECRSRFEALGFDAWSCDLKPNRNPKAKHYQQDIFDVINKGWHVFIAFPPCTHLAVSGAAHFKKKKADGRQQAAIDFFMAMINAPIECIATENPIGIMSSEYRKPDQIINPFHFGDLQRKPTCLWLKNLPKLAWSNENTLFYEKTTVEPEIISMTSKKTGRTRTYSKWEYEASCDQENRAQIRSKTFSGVAEAMAQQWEPHIIQRFIK